MKMYLIFLLLMLTANFIPSRNIDPDIQPYYDEYLIRLKQQCPDYYQPLSIDIKLSRLAVDGTEGQIIGLCIKRINGYTIMLDKKYWEQSWFDEKYELVFHELTHCILNENHSENPRHFMYFSANFLKRWEIDEQLYVLLVAKCHSR